MNADMLLAGVCGFFVGAATVFVVVFLALRRQAAAALADLNRERALEDKFNGWAKGKERAPSPAARVAASLLVLASSARHGARVTGYDYHKGACKAYLHALELLVQQFPDALDVARGILNEGGQALPVAASEFRAADAAEIAAQLIINRDLPSERFHDGVLPVDFNGQEAVARANETHRANRHVNAPVVDGTQRSDSSGATQ